MGEHDHGGDGPSDLALRVKALESLLVDKGLVDPVALDAIVATYEHQALSRSGRACACATRTRANGVRFAARELWGARASERDSVQIDLWEPYLERA